MAKLGLNKNCAGDHLVAWIRPLFETKDRTVDLGPNPDATYHCKHFVKKLYLMILRSLSQLLVLHTWM